MSRAYSEIATGTRVVWKKGTKRGGLDITLSSGVIEGYVHHDMPWKLYQIREEGTGRTAFVHPDHIVRTYGPPHIIS